MEAWKRAWREGFCPSLTEGNLKSLRAALEIDDPRLIQGNTVYPITLCLGDKPAEAACAVTYCGVLDMGGFAGSVKPCAADRAVAYFSHACFEADLRLGNPSECRWFLNWFDETPRDEMRRLLLEEVNLELEKRAGQGELQVQEV